MSQYVRVKERNAVGTRRRKIFSERVTLSYDVWPCTLNASRMGAEDTSRRRNASLRNSEFVAMEPWRWTSRARDNALRAENAAFRYHSGCGTIEKSTEKEIGQGEERSRDSCTQCR